MKVKTSEKYLLPNNFSRYTFDVKFTNDAEIYFGVTLAGESAVEII